MSKLLSPEDAAEILKVSPQWVRKLLNRGEIKGQKVGKNWVITEEAIEVYQAARQAAAKK